MHGRARSHSIAGTSGILTMREYNNLSLSLFLCLPHGCQKVFALTVTPTSYTFTGISFNVGDTVTISVQATSTTTGVATIVNRTKGTSVTHQFTPQSRGLAEVNAEWIVEDFQQNDGTLVPFANFGTVAFTNAYAYSSAVGYVGPSGGTLVDILQNGQILTSTSVGSTTVTVAHT